MTNKTTATTLLQEGQDILKARAALRDSDEGERSMARTVAIFNAWTGSSMSEENGWRFMIALKQAREIQGDFHKDDYQDLVNYSALLGECASCNLPEEPVVYQNPRDEEFYRWVHKGDVLPVKEPVVYALQSHTDAELAAFKEEAYRKPVYDTEMSEFFGKGKQQ